MALFSERNGYVKPQDILIKEQITTDIQNAICSCFDDLRFQNPKLFMDMEIHLWSKFLNLRKGEFSVTYVVATSYIEDKIKPWHKKIDIIEKSIEYLSSNYMSIAKDFVKNLNKEFERLHFAYRIVNNLFVEITSDEEIKAIETALKNKEDSVKLHLQTAINLYAKRPEGDYRNSIKESISAVEALCRKITGENTLGKAISKLGNNGIVLPNVLKKSFEQLYWYTNDKTTGIRHPLMDDTNAPTADEAIFMLVSCSAFINYLTKKINQ